MLALAGTFVYISVGNQLNDSIDEGLDNRATALAGDIGSVTRLPAGAVSDEDPEDEFTQVLGADGGLLVSSSPQLSTPALGPGALSAAADEDAGTDIGDLPGVDGGSRVIVRSFQVDGQNRLLLVGAAIQDRDDTLSGLATTFLIAIPLALLIASLVGYGLATAAMRPVEKIRQRARQITLARSGERLPLPRSHDEIFHLGETLNEMLARLEVSVERERSFVADASHELRTPLSIIRGELELGLKPDRDLDQARSAMASSQEEVERLLTLTEDLLAIARSDRPSAAVQIVEVPLADLLEDVRMRLTPAVGAHGRELRTRCPSDETAELEPRQMKRALGNLIENSLRHGAGAITVAAEVGTETVEFSVSDEGPGFSGDFAENAFDRFSRAESGRTTAGYGLGLAIVKSVAEAHGGTARIDTDAEGAKVVISIPLDSHRHFMRPE